MSQEAKLPFRYSFISQWVQRRFRNSWGSEDIQFCNGRNKIWIRLPGPGELNFCKNSTMVWNSGVSTAKSVLLVEGHQLSECSQQGQNTKKSLTDIRAGRRGGGDTVTKQTKLRQCGRCECESSCQSPTEVTPCQPQLLSKKTYLVLNQSGTFSLTSNTNSNTECEKVEMAHLGQCTNKNVEACRVRIVIRVK
jgi:hypothetical protein